MRRDATLGHSTSYDTNKDSVPCFFFCINALKIQIKQQVMLSPMLLVMRVDNLRTLVTRELAVMSINSGDNQHVLSQTSCNYCVWFQLNHRINKIICYPPPPPPTTTTKGKQSSSSSCHKYNTMDHVTLATTMSHFHRLLIASSNGALSSRVCHTLFSWLNSSQSNGGIVTLKPEQNCRLIADDIFKWSLWMETILCQNRDVVFIHKIHLQMSCAIWQQFNLRFIVSMGHPNIYLYHCNSYEDQETVDLTHGVLNKVATILQKHFQKHFRHWGVLHFD